MRLTPRNLLLFNGGSPAAAYDARVLATSPLRYNKLNETSGTAITDVSGNAYTGTYTGVELANTASPFAPDLAPFWDATNDYGDIYSAAFGTVFNFDEFTIMLWFKMNSSAVWTDGVSRYFVNLFRDANNGIILAKNSPNNTIFISRAGAGTSKFASIGGQSDTGWTSLALSASVSGGGLLTAGDLRAYKNGAQIGSTLTGNIAASSSGLNSIQTVIGSVNKTPVNVHHGWLSRFMIWNRPIDAAILALMTA